MFTLHCTAKLRDRLKRPLATTKPPPTTILGDWYGTVLFWKPQLALLVNERTLMPILLPLAPASTLAERLGPAVAALLHRYAMALPLIERELAAMAEIAIAKTSNRRVVGTMNEFAFEASAFREQMGVDKPCHAVNAARRNTLWRHRLQPPRSSIARSCRGYGSVMCSRSSSGKDGCRPASLPTLVDISRLRPRDPSPRTTCIFDRVALRY